MSPLEILWEYRQAFLEGLVVTAELLIITSVGGTLIAAFIEWICEMGGMPVRRIVDGIAFGIAAIPALVILFWFHYPAQALLDIVVRPFWTALAALMLLNIFSVYRIMADAIHDFPKQFVATGLVCGLTNTQITRFIKIPLILRAALPRWIDQQVVILQTSLFASLISVEETFRVAQRINSIVYRPVTIYTAMALLFLVTAGSAMYYARYLRSRTYRDFSER
ncbi:MAG: ABC transporter permease subunit [Ignavibacteriales bacterium]|nr:ABC transporter permease subunit [Ignavibacteriales bacterium]